jgi:hypothetical protein
LEDDEHTGRLKPVRTELNIQEVTTSVRANRSKTVNEMATTAAGISHGTCNKIRSGDLNLSRVTQHSLPCVLTQDQHEDGMSICGDLIHIADKYGTFLNQIIIGDETWCFLCDPQPKRQSATWKSPSSPRREKLRQDSQKAM